MIHQQRSEERIVGLYARGLTSREIQKYMNARYGVEVTPDRICGVTDAVLDRATRWHERRLDPVYPIVYFDSIRARIHSTGETRHRVVNVALAIDFDGYKDLLGLWLAHSEARESWRPALENLRDRGLENMLVACVDARHGLPSPNGGAHPEVDVKLGLVHLIRHSFRYVSWRERRVIAADLRKIYAAPDRDTAERALELFAAKWDSRFPGVSRLWWSQWENVTRFFEYPDAVRRVICTTNAIDSMHAALRKVTAKRGAFTSAGSARKVLFLATQKLSEGWKRPVKNWTAARQHLDLLCEERAPVRADAPLPR